MQELGRAVHRVAIVDDEESLSSLFSILVRRLGYHVEFVAHDGGEIVRAVMSDAIHPDIILMDYRMAVMNGLEAAERVRKVRPKIKVIMATADDSVRQDVISAGMYFIQKPFSMHELRRTLVEVLAEPDT